MKNVYNKGGLGVLWYIIWVLVVKSSPDKDRYISNDELVYIQSTVSLSSKNERIIPWKALLTSQAVYAIVISQAALNWGFNTMLTHMPTFLSGLCITIEFRLFNFHIYLNIIYRHT